MDFVWSNPDPFPLPVRAQLRFSDDVFPERHHDASVSSAAPGLRPRLPSSGFCENHKTLHLRRSLQGVPDTHKKSR